jgi:hypothetical protein
MTTKRHWQPKAFRALRQQLHHTYPGFAAAAIPIAQDYRPDTCSNFTSSIGAAATPQPLPHGATTDHGVFRSQVWCLFNFLFRL